MMKSRLLCHSVLATGEWYLPVCYLKWRNCWSSSGQTAAEPSADGSVLAAAVVPAAESPQATAAMLASPG